MTLTCDDGSKFVLKAAVAERLPTSVSPVIEMSSAHAFRKHVYKTRSEVFVCLLQDVFDFPESERKSNLEARIRREFADVLPEELPKGMPPERYLRDGRKLEHVVDTLPDAKPSAQRPYRMTNKEYEEVLKQIEHLMDSGWLRPSLSSWAAPILFLPKKDGKLRMCY